MVYGLENNNQQVNCKITRKSQCIRRRVTDMFVQADDQ